MALHKIIHTSILSPVGPNLDIAFQNLPIRLLLQKANKVICNLIGRITRLIRKGGQQDGILGITIGNGVRLSGVKGIIPEVEEGADFGLGYFGGTDGFLRHEGGMVMGDHPFTIFKGVDEGIAGFDLGSVFKGEFVDSWKIEKELFEVSVVQYSTQKKRKRHEETLLCA